MSIRLDRVYGFTIEDVHAAYRDLKAGTIRAARESFVLPIHREFITEGAGVGWCSGMILSTYFVRGYWYARF